MNKKVLIFLLIISIIFISACELQLPKIKAPSPKCCEILNLNGSTESCIKNIDEISCSSTYIGKDGYNYYSRNCSSIASCSNRLVCAYNKIKYQEGYSACSENKLYQCVNGEIKQIEENYYKKGAVYVG